VWAQHLQKPRENPKGISYQADASVHRLEDNELVTRYDLIANIQLWKVRVKVNVVFIPITRKKALTSFSRSELNNGLHVDS
jgi:hypothetical protein